MCRLCMRYGEGGGKLYKILVEISEDTIYFPRPWEYIAEIYF